MTDAPRHAPETPGRTRVGASPGGTTAMWWAIGALIIAVALALSFPHWRYHVPFGAQVALNYVLTWGPLAIALVATAAFWRRFVSFKWADVYLGLAIGLVARAIGILITLATTGNLPGSVTVAGQGVTALYVFTALIAPVVLAPLIEEPFFRGLLQGGLARSLPGWSSVCAASVIFMLVHTVASGFSAEVVITLLVYALLAGWAVQRTGRLGPGIIAHAVFNLLATLIAWPW